MKKRLIVNFLALCVLVNCLAFGAFASEVEDLSPVTEEATETTEAPAEETTEVTDATEAVPTEPMGKWGDLIWILEDGTLTITGSGPMDDCTEDSGWLPYKDQIKTVVLSGGVTTVGARAFADYDSLTAVDFGSSLTEIGKGAFQGCDGLTVISLPSTFKIFGEDCFRDCTRLTEIHCSGGFPSFRLNCLWNSYLKIIYPAQRPWPVSLIEELETAFQGRIEFLSSDGTDPYTPTEAIPEETKPAATTAPTTEPTEKPTEETTRPTEAPTEPTETEPAPTESTPEETEAETQPTEPEEKERRGGSWIGLALVLMVLSACGIGYVMFRIQLNRRGRFSDDDDYDD